MNGYLNKESYGDAPTCEARLTAPCVAALNAQGTAQTPARVEACVAQYPNYTCPDYFDNNPSGTCVPAAGAVANGLACGAAGQCTSTYCAVAQHQVCGICADLPVAGATCQVTADCGRNLACAVPTGATTGTCTAFAAAGAACLAGMTPCANGLACVAESVATKTMGKCAAEATTVGAACDASRATAANCARNLGLACIPTAKGSEIGTCQNITFVEAGATCGTLGSQPTTGVAQCHSSAVCIKVAATDRTGTCVAPAADGGACDSDPSKGPSCLAPAKCVAASATATAGTCTVPDATKCK